MEKILQTSEVMKRLSNLGLELPQPPSPGGQYEPVLIRGSVVYIAIQFPIANNELHYQGILGKDLTTEEGRKAAAMCALNVISQLHHHVGLERIEGLNHLEMVYQSADPWDEAPLVADGASVLFGEILGEQGKHTRALIGARVLSRSFCVGLVTSATLRS